MNMLHKSIEAFIASQGKTAAAGLKLRRDLQVFYLPENGVGAILRDIYGEDATRRTHEAQYNAIHYAWVTIGDDGKRKPRQPRQPKDGGKDGGKANGKDGGKDGVKLAQPVKLPISELSAWIRATYSLAEMRALKAEL